MLAFAGLAVGCSSPPTIHSGEATVKGRVLINNEPVQYGTVSVAKQSELDIAFSGDIKPDGTFEIRRCFSGPVRFAVDPAGVIPPPDAKPPAIPAAYRSLKTSPLNFDLRDGANADITLDIK
jgi:hypothetical protein